MFENLLFQTLHTDFCQTSAQKTAGEEPNYLAVGEYKLYYDEGNLTARLSDGRFWSELPEDLQNDIAVKLIDSRIVLDKEYELVCVDYRDELPPEIFLKCLDTHSLYPLTEQDYYGEAQANAAIATANGILDDFDLDSEEKEIFRGSEEFDNLRLAIEERDTSFPKKEIWSKARIHGRVQLHSNYDCWIDIWEAGGLWGEDGALTGVMAVLSLNPRKVKEEALRQGVACHGRWPDKKNRNGKEVVNYDAFIKSLRECPNYGNWAFFGVFDMNAMWDILRDGKHSVETLTIPADTLCGMYNSWNGGGTNHMIRTIRPLDLKEIARIQKRYSDGYTVRVDERGCSTDGYIPSEVYGEQLSDDIFLT